MTNKRKTASSSSKRANKKAKSCTEELKMTPRRSPRVSASNAVVSPPLDSKTTPLSLSPRRSPRAKVPKTASSSASLVQENKTTPVKMTVEENKTTPVKMTVEESKTGLLEQVKEENRTVALKSNNKMKNEAVSVTNEAVAVKNESEDEEEDGEPGRFLGEPIELEEAKTKWPHRYRGKKQMHTGKDDTEDVIQARRHYTQANVDGVVYLLNDDVYVMAGKGEDCYICKIVEMFEAVDKILYFTAQWYYRAKDTVIKDHASFVDSKRVFFSEVRDENPLDCLVKKLKIVRLNLSNKTSIPACDYYCDMMYLLPFSTFVKLPPSEDNEMTSSEGSSTLSSEVNLEEPAKMVRCNSEVDCQVWLQNKSEVRLLDLYSGCGAMSTGLCLGANLSNLNLVTKWAVDFNKYACESLKFNHPETEVRNEAAEDFLSLLKEWMNLCIYFGLVSGESTRSFEFEDYEDDEDESGSDDDNEPDSEIYEVENVLSICHGDPKENGEIGLWFKVHWKGYGEDADSWEPLDGLRCCKKAVKEFVVQGFKKKILPLPGDVDVVCGGPPCQGISGFNRFRNKENPLKDEKNKQLVVFMDIVRYLKPRFVLMENVVDLLRFAGGFLGRYALGKLVGMDYQARIGMLVAGAYGLPQFRMRVFMWGAHAAENLPQYPLPTHDVVARGNVPVEFEMNAVAYEEGHGNRLEEKLLLKDAISDLPVIGNYESRDEMPYDKDPESEFQKMIRSKRNEPLGASSDSQGFNLVLYDHRSLELNEDDYERVCQIPKKKGANFRDLQGVIVKPDKKVAFDSDMERVYLKSGKPLVPDYAMSFIGGTSSKPFGRLWWDETVSTVVTRAEPHNQIVLHPEQDRVLSIRENARLQGFPDYYKLSGPIKERYIQVGNAVAVPVARALGYSLAQAIQGTSGEGPVYKLPQKFPNILDKVPSSSSQDEAIISS